MAVGADGNTAITGAVDGTVRLWDVPAARSPGAPLTMGAPIRAIAYHPARQLLAVASESGVVGVWRIDEQRRLVFVRQMRPRAFAIGLGFNPAGTVLLTRSQRAVQRWDADSGRLLGDSPQEGRNTSEAAFRPDGRAYALAVVDVVHQWGVADNRPIGLPLRHVANVCAFVYHPRGRVILTGCADGTARLWDSETATVLDTIHLPAPVKSVAFSRDGTAFAIACKDGIIRMWRPGNLAAPGRALAHEHNVWAVSFSPDGRTLLAAGGDSDQMARTTDPRQTSTYADNGEVCFWDAATGRPLRKAFFRGAIIRAAAFGATGTTFATAGSDNGAWIWDAETVRPVRGPLRHKDWVCTVAFSPDSKWLLTGSMDGTARLWDGGTGAAHGSPLLHPGPVNAVTFHPDRQVAVTGCDDGTARLWRAETGQPTGQPMSHSASVSALAVSPDGGLLLAGYDDHAARFWESGTGRLWGKALSHRGRVLGVAFSPDGRIAATASLDRTAQLWDVDTGQPIGPPLSHRTEVRAVAFHPQGTMIATAEAKAAHVWSVPPPLDANPVRAVLWVQVVTGMELDPSGAIVPLNDATWRQRRRQLQALGGPAIDLPSSLGPSCSLDTVVTGPPALGPLPVEARQAIPDFIAGSGPDRVLPWIPNAWRTR